MIQIVIAGREVLKAGDGQPLACTSAGWSTGLVAGARNCTEQPDQMQKNAKVRCSFGADSVQ